MVCLPILKFVIQFNIPFGMSSRRFSKRYPDEANLMKNMDTRNAEKKLSATVHTVKGILDLQQLEYGLYHLNGMVETVDSTTFEGFQTMQNGLSPIMDYFKYQDIDHLLSLIRMSQLTDKSTESLFGAITIKGKIIDFYVFPSLV